jgi:hypothetical protein
MGALWGRENTLTAIDESVKSGFGVIERLAHLENPAR